MVRFKLGDKVEAIDDMVQGVITKMTLDTITIESEEGFELNYKASELLPIMEKSALKVSSYDVARVKGEKDLPTKKAGLTSKKREAFVPTMEVDLHIGHLLPSTKGMSNFDILNAQLDTAKRQLEFAIQKRIRKVVFIHGVGEGVLREELHYLLKKYENNRFYDADHLKYGLGATEVYIFQK